VVRWLCESRAYGAVFLGWGGGARTRARARGFDPGVLGVEFAATPQAWAFVNTLEVPSSHPAPSRGAGVEGELPAPLELDDVRWHTEPFELRIPVRPNRAEPVQGTVDRQNPGFVGRRDELHRLREMLTSGTVGVITAVHGLGGVGKTTLPTSTRTRSPPSTQAAGGFCTARGSRTCGWRSCSSPLRSRSYSPSARHPIWISASGASCVRSRRERARPPIETAPNLPVSCCSTIWTSRLCCRQPWWIGCPEAGGSTCSDHPSRATRTRRGQRKHISFGAGRATRGGGGAARATPPAGWEISERG